MEENNPTLCRLLRLVLVEVVYFSTYTYPPYSTSDLRQLFISVLFEG